MLNLILSQIKNVSNSYFFKFSKWLILSILLCLFIYLSGSINVINKFIQISGSSLIIFLTFVLLSKVLYAYRWYFIGTQGLNLNYLSWHYLLRLNLLAEFSELSMLSSLSGEALRLIKLSSYTRKPALSATSIMADRLIGLSSMIIFVIVLFPHLSLFLGETSFLSKKLCILLFTLAIIIGLFFALCCYKKVIQLLPVFKKTKLSFKCIAISVCISLIGHFFFASSYYILFQEFKPVTFLLVLAIVFTAQLSNVLPFSFLGIAPSEASIVALSSLMGVTQTSALVVVTTVVASKYVFALCGFLIELSLDGTNFFIAMRKNRKLK